MTLVAAGDGVVVEYESTLSFTAAYGERSPRWHYVLRFRRLSTRDWQQLCLSGDSREQLEQVGRVLASVLCDLVER